MVLPARPPGQEEVAQYQEAWEGQAAQAPGVHAFEYHKHTRSSTRVQLSTQVPRHSRRATVQLVMCSTGTSSYDMVLPARPPSGQQEVPQHQEAWEGEAALPPGVDAF
jgi:hypothetical protein